VPGGQRCHAILAERKCPGVSSIEVMGRRLRFILDRELVEVTCRTIQGRFLLKPVPGWRETFVGALARAQRLYPVRIHAFVCLSNHFHLLVSPEDAQALAGFMRHLLSKLSMEAGRRHGWRGPLFHRRYQAIPISDEKPAQIHRLRYLVSHGVKENLVRRVADWPGPHCGPWLVESKAAPGVWHDRTREWAARNRGAEFAPGDLEEQETLTLEPLPCWQHLSPELQRRRVGELVKEVEQEAADRRVPFLGMRAVLQQHPLRSVTRSERACGERSGAPTGCFSAPIATQLKCWQGETAASPSLRAASPQPSPTAVPWQEGRRHRAGFALIAGLTGKLEQRFPSALGRSPHSLALRSASGSHRR
jgi:REP-associated tyrosine transposase